MRSMIGVLCFCLVVSGYCRAGEIHVVRVSDGDTLVVNDNGEQKYVTIFGVDAPESGQTYAKEAKQFVEEVIFAGKYRLKMNPFEKMSGESCQLYFVDPETNFEMDLACSLLLKGYGFVDSRIKKDSADNRKYLSSENLAKNKKAGVWSLARVEFPWNYRKRLGIVDEETFAANKLVEALGTKPRRG